VCVISRPLIQQWQTRFKKKGERKDAGINPTDVTGTDSHYDNNHGKRFANLPSIVFGI